MKGNTLDLEASNFVLGRTLSECLPSLAVKLLAEGYDSSALRMLAGLTESQMDEAGPLFKQALLEIGCSLPSPREAVLRLARETAMQILQGEIAPYEGGKRIWDLSLKIDHVVPELHPFVYAASEWEDRPEDRPLFERGILEEARVLVVDD